VDAVEFDIAEIASGPSDRGIKLFNSRSSQSTPSGFSSSIWPARVQWLALSSCRPAPRHSLKVSIDKE
jgi:hypothetical protein